MSGDPVKATFGDPRPAATVAVYRTNPSPWKRPRNAPEKKRDQTENVSSIARAAEPEPTVGRVSLWRTSVGRR